MSDVAAINLWCIDINDYHLSRVPWPRRARTGPLSGERVAARRRL
jgi:hypothetical protein